MFRLSTLSAWDYAVIFPMLLFSSAIGVFFALRSRRRQSSDTYFLGDRNMSVIPVSISLSATFVSAITYLGTPAEVYIHGPKFGLLTAMRLLIPFVLMYCFIPVFYRLEITTVYEYLGKRFNNTVRFLVVVAEVIGGFLYMGIVLYTPSLVLSTVTGLSLSFSILATGLICTFYTAIGGMKAVIWTDVFQAATMLLAGLIMIIVGTLKIGGPAEGWRRAAIGERTQLVDFDIDPTIRLTFWTICVGGSSFLLMIMGTKQQYAQRYLACDSLGSAQLASWVGIIGAGMFELIAVTLGMVVFAYYYLCDPLTHGRIQRPDQIVPYFVMDVFGSSPGVPGFLISGAFCASLSSMSSVLNAMASMTGQDIIKTIWPTMSETHYSIVIRVISAIFGLFTVALAFLASVMGDVLQTALSISGLSGGPSLGVFILGLFFPKANSFGATVGFTGGILVGMFFYIGSQFHPAIGNRLPLTVAGCQLNETQENISEEWMVTEMEETLYTTVTPESPGNSIFALSYMYYTTVTAVACILIGVVLSYAPLTKSSSTAHPSLLAPFIAHKYRRLESHSPHMHNININNGRENLSLERK